jgi:hypothetical protein
MPRLLLLLLPCAIFIACSSDESVALKEWFNDQGIAASYGKDYDEFEVSVKNSKFVADSIYMVSSFLAFGSLNGVEQSFYVGLSNFDKFFTTWKFRADTTFYSEMEINNNLSSMDAKIYWLIEEKIEIDSTWLEFKKSFTDSSDIKLELKGETFSFTLPPKLLDRAGNSVKDSVKLLAYIKPVSNGHVLRFAPPNPIDIPGLLRVAQKSIISDECEQCLHSGAGEVLRMSFDIKDKITAGRTVVFAQLILPKQENAPDNKNEFDYPMPVYVSGFLDMDSSLVREDYRVDTVYVNKWEHHPNLVFWEGDSLRLQITRTMRICVDAAYETLDLNLWLGTPMLIPESRYFYNYREAGKEVIVLANRPSYSRYDFSSILGKKAKIKIWYAKTDID